MIVAANNKVSVMCVPGLCEEKRRLCGTVPRSDAEMYTTINDKRANTNGEQDILRNVSMLHATALQNNLCISKSTTYGVYDCDLTVSTLGIHHQENQL